MRTTMIAAVTFAIVAVNAFGRVDDATTTPTSTVRDAFAALKSGDNKGASELCAAQIAALQAARAKPDDARIVDALHIQAVAYLRLGLPQTRFSALTSRCRRIDRSCTTPRSPISPEGSSSRDR